MKVLFLSSYGKSDTRTSAFIRSLRNLAKVVCVTKKVSECTEAIDEKDDLVYWQSGIRGAIQMVLLSLRAAKAIGSIDVLFIDNRLATIPALLVRKLFSPKLVLQDARELYLRRETKHFSGKLGCIFEQMSLKNADIVFCANKYRADIMRDEMNIKCPIYVFENVFTINYDQNFVKDEAEEKYGNLFIPGRFTILSSSGCALIRTTDKFVRAMKRFEGQAELLLVGKNNPSDEHCIRQIIKEDQIQNVHIVGPVDKNVLKWMIEKCDAGIAIYGKEDKNNLYCASGKIYEFLTGTKPVIVSENPPLIDLCNQTQIGVVSDHYEDAIAEMIKKYNQYADNVKAYLQVFDISKGEKKLTDYLRDAMKGLE